MSFCSYIYQYSFVVTRALQPGHRPGCTFFVRSFVVIFFFLINGYLSLSDDLFLAFIATP